MGKTRKVPAAPPVKQQPQILKTQTITVRRDIIRMPNGQVNQMLYDLDNKFLAGSVISAPPQPAAPPAKPALAVAPTPQATK